MGMEVRSLATLTAGRRWRGCQQPLYKLLNLCLGRSCLATIPVNERCWVIVQAGEGWGMIFASECLAECRKYILSCN